MTDRLDLADRHRLAVEALLAEHVPQAEVWAYGSRVNGRSHAASDLDLVLRSRTLKPVPLGRLSDLNEAFEESNIPLIVQVHDWARIPTSFHDEIKRQYFVLQTAPDEADSCNDRWTTFRLGDACTKIGSGATPSGGSNAYQNTGPYALIRSQNVHNHQFRHEGLAYIDDKQARKLSNVEVYADDVLLNITGDSVARSCQVDPAILPARVNQHVAIIRTDRSILSPSFLRYALIEPSMQEQLLSLADSGGTRKALTKRDIESLSLVVPQSVRHQEKISNILETLDAKIELNRRISKTLEEMARALFNSWFVDFDPVRAKAEGRSSGLPSHLDSLFPNSFQSSELGPIPDGWTVEPLSEVADHLHETEYPGASPSLIFTHYSIPAYDSGQRPVYQYGRYIKSNKTILKPGAVLISRLNPEIERVWIPDLVNGERAVCSTEFLVIISRSPFTTSYVYCLARSKHIRQNIQSLVTGTSKSHQRSPANQTMSIKVPVPPHEIITAFDLYARSMLQRMLQCRAACSALSSLLDVVLPRLLRNWPTSSAARPLRQF